MIGNNSKLFDTNGEKTRRDALRAVGGGLAGAGLFSGTTSARTRPAETGTGGQHWETTGWRDWQSPIRRETIPAGYHRAFSTVEMGRAQLDTRALNDLVVEGEPFDVPPGLEMTVINVERDEHGVPHYRYFSTESAVEMAANETWSSSKFMVAAAAAARIRQESGGSVGFDSTIDGGQYGRLHVGELLSKMHSSYTIDPGNPFSTNRLGAWFLDVAGAQWANELVTEWLDSPLSNLGINYGQRSSGFSKTFTDDTTGTREWVGNGDEPAGPNKTVTTLSGAEFLKRLVMHREDRVTRMPGFRAPADAELFWTDLKTLFYGEPGRRRGGMSNNSHPLLLEAAEGIPAIDTADDDWRAFSKIGWGTSARRDVSEVTWHGYGCFPTVTGEASEPELFVSLHYSRPSGASIREDLVPAIRWTLRHVLRAVTTGELDQQAAPPKTGGDLFDLDGHWAEAEIRRLAADGVVSGYPDGTVRADESLTRAAFATMVASAFDLSSSRTGSFVDIEDHWARDPIVEAAGAGFFSGYEDGSFRPEQLVTKTEAIVALANGLGLEDGARWRLRDAYTDADAVPDWAGPTVAGALAAGVVDERPFPLDDRLEPRAIATRAEVLSAIASARSLEAVDR
jgi:hypothetical protein